MINERSPIPGGVAPGVYTVKPNKEKGGACAHPEAARLHDLKGLFMVPYKDDAHSKGVRAHEYGHLVTMEKGYLPKRGPEALQEQDNTLDEMWTQVYMDAYVNSYMLRKGVTAIQGLESEVPDSFSALPDDVIRKIIACDYLRMKTSHSFEENLPIYKKILPPSDREFLDETYRQVMEHEVLDAKELAKRIRSVQEKFKSQADRPIGSSQDSSGTGEAGDRLSAEERKGEEGNPQTGMARAAKQIKGINPAQRREEEKLDQQARVKAYLTQKAPNKEEQEARQQMKSLAENYSYDDSARWGDLDVVIPQLPKRSRSSMRGINRAPGYAGAFRYPNRALISSDGRAFNQKLMTRGGTVLVDCSGSMSLSQQQIEDFFSLAPASTIAVYGGYTDGRRCPPMIRGAVDHRPREAGVLVQIAKKGKNLGNLKLRDWVPMLNIVDGPALDWLLKQPAPRVWVSDGYVTGVDEDHSSALVYDAIDKVRRGKIIQVLSMSSAIALAKKNWEGTEFARMKGLGTVHSEERGPKRNKDRAERR